jgi:FkbM family methyltransferase
VVVALGAFLLVGSGELRVPRMLNYSDMRFLIRCLRYRYKTERLAIKTLMSLNLSGATVLDIGANKGIYSFWMAKAVGETGRVLAFEPQPEMRNYIERRKKNFGWQNVTAFETALSSTAGVATLERQRIGDGSASLQPSRHRNCSETIRVPLVRLDDMESLSNLKFIKCDVEGHEQQVFLGAESTIRRHRPVVQFESVAEEAPLLFSFFLNLGYSGVMLLGDQYLHYTNPDKVPHYKFGQGGHRDYLFFHPETAGDTIPFSVLQQFPHT